MGRTFEESILKAVRSLETGQFGLSLKNGDTMTDEWIENGFVVLEMNDCSSLVKRFVEVYP